MHADQGSVCSSISYNELIKDYNIKRSMSRAGTPTDNPVDESLNRWIKEELFLDFDLGHSLDVKQSIIDYVKYYNNERPAYSLKYKTPTQFKSELVLNQVWYMSTFAWQVHFVSNLLFQYGADKRNRTANQTLGKFCFTTKLCPHIWV